MRILIFVIFILLIMTVKAQEEPWPMDRPPIKAYILGDPERWEESKITIIKIPKEGEESGFIPVTIESLVDWDVEIIGYRIEPSLPHGVRGIDPNPYLPPNSIMPAGIVRTDLWTFYASSDAEEGEYYEDFFIDYRYIHPIFQMEVIGEVRIDPFIKLVKPKYFMSGNLDRSIPIILSICLIIISILTIKKRR